MDTSPTSRRIEQQTRWSLRLFGDVQLSERGSGEKVALPGKRERVLLAYLALSPNGRQPRRKLVTLLWGEAADETTLENLRTAVFNLRKALGDTERQIIASEDRDMVLDTSAFEVDVLSFRRLATGPGVAELEEAVKLYAGDFLEGLSIDSEEFESWRREEATRSKGQALDALTRLMTQLAASGDSERAIETGLRTLRLEPLHEAAVRRLMRLYVESGRRAAAVELYRTLSEALKKELGAQPEAETRAVYAEITQGNEGRAAAVAEAKSPLLSPTIVRPNDTRSAPSPEHFVPAIDPPTQSAPQKVTRRTIGRLAAGGLAAAAIAILLLLRFAPSTGPIPAAGPPTVVAATSTSAIALAVLPFANLSGERDQEFFSDGLTEEITAALAKVPDLKVVARTSAFEFKGKNINIKTIGEQLGATHLIEGSVRKDGNRLRITAQLIKADDGTHMWAEEYDRQLTDIFQIQEDIARAIATSLRSPLGLKPGQNLVSSRAVDPEIYQEFLRIRAKQKSALDQGSAGRLEAIEGYEKLLARAPDFAQAWAYVSGLYFQAPYAALLNMPIEEVRRELPIGYEKSEKAAREALRLDGSQVKAYGTLALVESHRNNWSAAEDLLRKGLEIDPHNPDFLASYGIFLMTSGRVKQALQAMQEVHALEPLVPAWNAGLGWNYVADGQADAVITLLRGKSGIGNMGQSALAQAYAVLGQFDKAADAILAFGEGRFRQSLGPPVTREQVALLMRSAPQKVSDPKALPALHEELSFVYAYIGAEDRLLDFAERALEAGVFAELRYLFSPAYSSARKTKRFKTLVRKAGLVDYWNARGWPDMCHPTTGDDFSCS